MQQWSDEDGRLDRSNPADWRRNDRSWHNLPVRVVRDWVRARPALGHDSARFVSFQPGFDAASDRPQIPSSLRKITLSPSPLQSRVFQT